MCKIVIPHDPAWRTKFQIEANLLGGLFGDHAVRIHHIGSTAIPGILAKPIIDILIETNSLSAVDLLTPALEKAGYTAKGEYGITERRYFQKSESGIRSYHIHVFMEKSEQAIRHLTFKEYLLAVPDKAKAYSKLKHELTTRAGATKESYITGKADFVQQTEKEALRWLASKLQA